MEATLYACDADVSVVSHNGDVDDKDNELRETERRARAREKRERNNAGFFLFTDFFIVGFPADDLRDQLFLPSIVEAYTINNNVF